MQQYMTFIFPKWPQLPRPSSLLSDILRTRTQSSGNSIVALALLMLRRSTSLVFFFVQNFIYNLLFPFLFTIHDGGIWGKVYAWNNFWIWPFQLVLFFSINIFSMLILVWFMCCLSVCLTFSYSFDVAKSASSFSKLLSYSLPWSCSS